MLEDETPFKSGSDEVGVWDGCGLTFARSKERWTRGEISASTWRARRADKARRWVGRGRSMTLVEESVRPLSFE